MYGKAYGPQEGGASPFQPLSLTAFGVALYDMAAPFSVESRSIYDENDCSTLKICYIHKYWFRFSTPYEQVLAAPSLGRGNLPHYDVLLSLCSFSSLHLTRTTRDKKSGSKVSDKKPTMPLIQEIQLRLWNTKLPFSPRTMRHQPLFQNMNIV